MNAHPVVPVEHVDANNWDGTGRGQGEHDAEDVCAQRVDIV